MVVIGIAFICSLLMCGAVCLLVFLVELITAQLPTRPSKRITSLTQRQQPYTHSPARNPVSARHIPPPKQGQKLRKTVAQPDRSESWRWKKAHQQLEARKKEIQNNTASTSMQPVTGKVQKQLFTLVNGEMKTANRLLTHTRKTNPLESEQWVWEKVIHDLERDRL